MRNVSKGKTTKPSRGNGHGSLERRPNGYWLARWTNNGKRYSQIIRDDDGEPVTDRRTAEQILEKITAPYRLESEADTAAMLATKAAGREAELKAWKDKQPALGIGEAFVAYRNSLKRPQGANAATLDRYETYYNQFAAWLAIEQPGYTELRDITPADANAYARDFIARNSGGTFNKHLVLLRSMWRVLAADDEDKAETIDGHGPRLAKLTCNPWENIRKRQHTPYRKRELTIEEARRVCSTLEGELRLLFAVGLYTGQRLGDCCLLKWRDIDLRRGAVSTVPHKTAKHNTRVWLAIHPELARLLEEIPAKERGEYVMPSMAATYKTDGGSVKISNRVQEAFAAAGIATQSENPSGSGKARVEVGFHSLRHTFVSMLGNSGTSLALVQAMVGHTNTAMTQHYFHGSESAIRTAVNQLPNVIEAEYTEIPPNDAQGNLAAFREIVQRMTADERHKAAAWLADYNEKN